MSRILFAFALVASLALTAPAALVYELRFAQTNINLGIGQSQTIDLFFDETFALSDTPRLDLTTDALPTNGLTSASFQINTTGPGGSSITAASGNLAFDLTSVASVGPPTTFSQTTLLSPVFASETGNVRSVQIGSITVTGGGTIGDVTTFSFADFNPMANDFLIGNGLDPLDFVADSSISFGSLNVTAVPEPSSLIALALVGSIGVYQRSRRRKQTVLNQSTNL